MQNFAQLLVSNTFNAVWCSLTAVYAIVWLLRFRFQRAKIVRDLQAAHKARSDLKISSPRDLYENFESLSKRIERLPTLRHAWLEFDECLLRTPVPVVLPPGAPSERDVPPIENTRSPRDYFNLTTVVEPHIHIRFYNTVPNHLTGFGILGTFVGLAAGVGLAQTGLAGQDFPGMQRALGLLLSGASLAFMTSIVGLLFAIVFLVSERVMMSRLVKSLDEWAEFLESNLKLVTVEGLAHRQLSEVTAQRRLLENFTTELASVLATTLNDKFSETIVPVLKDLVGAVEELRDRGTQASDQILKSVVEQLGEVVAGATRGEVDALGQTLRTAAESLTSTVASLEKSQGVMTSAVEEATQNMQRALGQELEGVQRQLESFAAGLDTHLNATVSRVAGGLEEAGKSGTVAFTAAIARLEQAVAGLVEFQASSSAARRELDSATNTLRESVAAVNDAAKGFSTIALPLRTAVQGFSDAGSHIREASARIERVGESFAEAAETIGQSGETMRQAWSEYRERFEEVDRTLGELTQQLHQFVDNFVDKASGFVSQMDQQLARSVQTLAGAVTELDGTIDDMRQDRRK